MAVGKFDVIEQYLDNNGALLAGGLVYTYAGGTSTPLAVYTSSTGGTPQANPVVLDSSGRPPGDGIWFTVGTSYKVIIKTAAGVTLETVDGLVLGSGGGGGGTTVTVLYPLSFEFLGGTPPETLEIMGVHAFTSDVDFAANWSGSYGHCVTNPTASFTITVKQNGSTVGTVVIGTGGAFGFFTSGGAAMPFVAGDYMTLHAPVGVDATLADVGLTFHGTPA